MQRGRQKPVCDKHGVAHKPDVKGIPHTSSHPEQRAQGQR